jgi:hypothetical protein
VVSDQESLLLLHCPCRLSSAGGAVPEGGGGGAFGAGAGRCACDGGPHLQAEAGRRAPSLDIDTPSDSTLATDDLHDLPRASVFLDSSNKLALERDDRRAEPRPPGRRRGRHPAAMGRHAAVRPLAPRLDSIRTKQARLPGLTEFCPPCLSSVSGPEWMKVCCASLAQPEPARAARARHELPPSRCPSSR